MAPLASTDQCPPLIQLFLSHDSIMTPMPLNNKPTCMVFKHDSIKLWQLNMVVLLLV
jgi:hypothetical protein